MFLHNTFLRVPMGNTGLQMPNANTHATPGRTQLGKLLGDLSEHNRDIRDLSFCELYLFWQNSYLH